ncbi:MAG TPA: lysyl oxidase family protein, partial [Candidatus Dormibacteraeota bacterium]|nr:lysyl oxidase family protein [Candidatus Dormibacteraeota bacterium]
WASQRDNYLYDWYLDQEEPTEPGRTLMRVSTATPNTGAGPLELRGSSTTPGVMQRIYRADGSFYDREAGIFTFHPGHGHLHFDNWINLRLRTVLANNGVGDIVAAGHKTSFAIIDLRTYNASLPGSPSAAVYDGGLVQGLSVGWADVYGAGLLDQWIDVTDVPSGRYWLEAIVDPENNIRESNESNNAARILIDYTQLPPLTNAPPNDHFSNALEVTTIVASFATDNTDCTRDPLEPVHYPGATGKRSLWWRWTAPTNMTAVVTTDGSGIDTVLAVYTGTALGNLVSLASDDDGGIDSASRVSFQAQAGTAYFVVVDSSNGDVGPIQLNFNPAWNDPFNNCVTLIGEAGTITGSNFGASKQPGEPTITGNAGGSSVWYCWTAPRSGPTTVDTVGSDFDTLLAVYTGNALGALTLIAADNNTGGNGTSRLTFNALSNVTYRI